MASHLRIVLVFLILGATQSAHGEGEPIAAATKPNPRPVNFTRHPSDPRRSCFACHGPDDKTRKAGLRLDTKEGAFAKLKEGGLAIVPGKAEESELIDRIESEDPDLHMPPKKSGKQLTPDQVATLRRWIEQGATWSTHWAFEAPRKPPLPSLRTPTVPSMRSIVSSWPGSRPRAFPHRPWPTRRL